MINHQKEYIGQGLAFPISVNARGELALVSGATDIEQAIRIILETIPGERVMRPEFGCRAWELVFAPNNAATHALLAYYVEQALNFWEPRIQLQGVTVENSEDNQGVKLLATIAYQIKDTHDRRSIVYPFYLMGEE